MSKVNAEVKSDHVVHLVLRPREIDDRPDVKFPDGKDVSRLDVRRILCFGLSFMLRPLHAGGNRKDQAAPRICRNRKHQSVVFVFSKQVFSTQAGCELPSDSVLTQALQEMGVDPENVLVLLDEMHIAGGNAEFGPTNIMAEMGVCMSILGKSPCGEAPDADSHDECEHTCSHSSYSFLFCPNAALDSEDPWLVSYQAPDFPAPVFIRSS